MNVEIEQLAITLQDVPIALGDNVADQMERVIRRALSELKLRTAGTGVANVDLGVISAPAHADANTITELIASSIVSWITREHGDEPVDASASAAAAAGGAAGGGR